MIFLKSGKPASGMSYESVRVGSVLPSLLDVGRLELLKWSAFVAMVCDHVDLALFDRSVPWLHSVGAFAFPAFCLTFGLGLARSRDAFDVADRLVVAGLLAEVAWLLIRPEHPVNVLLMFALCAVAVACWKRWRFWPAFVVVLPLAAAFGEGGVALPVLVGAAYAAGRTGWRWPVVLAGGAWLALVPTVGAALAVAAVLLWPSSFWRVMRARGALAWAYPAHLGALSAIKGFL